jgi:hypothetical protein
MMTPTIHLNGTSKEVLMEQVLDALNGLRGALNAMEAAAPNARDYYPQLDRAFERARKEHEERCMRVRKVMEEYGLMLDTIDSEIK